MQYFDRQENVLTEKEWKRLYADRSYSLVLRTETNEAICETWWVGVVHPAEDGRKLFLVHIHHLACASHKAPKHPWYWFRAEKDALAKHKRLLPAPALVAKR